MWFDSWNPFFREIWIYEHEYCEPYLSGPAGMPKLNMRPIHRKIATAKQVKSDRNQQLNSDSVI